jgi:hypothetical protein
VDAIWDFNDGEDKYQMKSKQSLRRDPIERDHVIEVQLLNRAFDTMPVPYRTRAAQATIKSVINDVANLNNTTQAINQKKKGPFTKAINQMSHNDHTCPGSFDIDAYVTEKHYEFYETGVWSKVKDQVVLRYDDVQTQVNEDGTDATKAFCDHLHEMLASMDIV